MPRIGAQDAPRPFTEERILAEGQQIFQEASFRIAKRQPTFQALQRTLNDLERRLRPIADGYRARATELGRDAAAPFPPIMHWEVTVNGEHGGHDGR